MNIEDARCGTCRFWRVCSEPWQDHNFGRCAVPATTELPPVWIDNANENIENEPDRWPDNAVLINENVPRIRTGKNFGCVHYKPLKP